MFNLFKKEKKEPQNLGEVGKKLDDLEKKIGNLSVEIKEMKKKNVSAIQKVGIVRFNPFREVGGDQSFSAALLDDKNDGIIITSHYTREGNRVYGKPITAGGSEYLLSEEEKMAIEKAGVFQEENIVSARSDCAAGVVDGKKENENIKKKNTKIKKNLQK